MAANAPGLQRPRGDKCTARAFARGDDGKFAPPSGWEDLKHGGLAYEENGHCGTDTWVVIANEDGSKGIENIGVSAGYAEGSAVVSRQIEDPLDFYADVLDESLYQGVTTINFDGCPRRYPPGHHRLPHRRPGVLRLVDDLRRVLRDRQPLGGSTELNEENPGACLAGDPRPRTPRATKKEG